MSAVAEALTNLLADDPRRPDGAIWPRTCHTGCGRVLLAGTVLTTGWGVGRHVVVMSDATVRREDRVADLVTLGADGQVVVEDHAYLGTSAGVRERTTVASSLRARPGRGLLPGLPPDQPRTAAPARPRPKTTTTTISMGSSS